MATAGRGPEPPLDEALRREPFRFDFFQAVRLLGRLAPGRAPVGRDAHPSEESARFRSQPGLNFPASAVVDVSGMPADDEGHPPTMTVAFLGLTGPSGVLPHPYTELARRRGSADNPMAGFLDLFHHRLVSLFYRAWEKHRPILAHERGEPDGLDGHLFDLIGLGPAATRGRHSFADAALLYYSGMFARRERPAVVLEALLREYFGLPIEVHQFQGSWLTLADADRLTVGVGGRHNGLGVDLVVGGRVWDEQGRIRLRVGPVGLAEYLNLLPDGPALRPLAQMARLFVNGEFEFDIQLVLKADEVPACRLSPGPGSVGARLGRHAWLKSRPMGRDVDDAIFPAGV